MYEYKQQNSLDLMKIKIEIAQDETCTKKYCRAFSEAKQAEKNAEKFVHLRFRKCTATENPINP